MGSDAYRMGKKKESNEENKKTVSEKEVMFGDHHEKFDILQIGTKRHLKDKKSAKSSYIPIEVCDDKIYLSEPDGKLIPDTQGQHKCDFLLHCVNVPQTCFVELKGANISSASKYNPYDQIIDTVEFLKNEEILKKLVDGKVKKHAFIVSPGRQKIPKGIETKERQLWQVLQQNSQEKTTIEQLIHYVKVTPTDRYSNSKGQIVCSPSSPVKIPFKN